MTIAAAAERQDVDLTSRYRDVRAMTDLLAAPLSPEDQVVQSMPDASPTKWHRAHTTWFFETFLLQPSLAGYREFHPEFRYLFNSYYNTVGAQFSRPDRGVISRPGVREVAEYRAHVDAAMDRLLSGSPDADVLALVELGLNHEQQHQELLLMDIKHVLAQNPLRPAYEPAVPLDPAPPTRDVAASWVEHPGGLVAIGHDDAGFAYDNEGPRHETWLHPFALSSRPVTNGDWLEFIEDGGYRQPEHWLSDGWATVTEQGWEAPLYWSRQDGGWEVFTLTGQRPVDPAEPVCHVSYYEADAFARWAGARLPTEFEWEAVAASAEPDGNFLAPGTGLHPRPADGVSGLVQLFGDVWEWTSSAYLPYPGYRPAEGAVGEYNGKFMVNQHVLRGGCCATPLGHVRATYRNFFPPSARWMFSGVRLAR